MYGRQAGIEFLFTPADPCAGPALRLLRQVLAEEGCERPVTIRVIADEDEAVRHRFHGSPTILIDGVDIEGPSLDRDGYHLRCRVYHAHGELLGVPDASVIRTALRVHPAKRRPSQGSLVPHSSDVV